MKNCSHRSSSSPPQGLTYWSQCRGGICKNAAAGILSLKVPERPRAASAHWARTHKNTHTHTIQAAKKTRKKTITLTRHFLYLTCLKLSPMQIHWSGRRVDTSASFSLCGLYETEQFSPKQTVLGTNGMLIGDITSKMFVWEQVALFWRGRQTPFSPAKSTSLDS